MIKRGTFPIHSYEVDASGVLTPASLGGYLLELARVHATALGVGMDTLMDRGLTWVLARMRISVSRPLVLDEVLTIDTWPSGVERLFALRDFRVRDAEGAEVARAASQWLVLSLETRRAVWPDEAFGESFREPGERVFEHGFTKLPPPGELEEDRRLETRYQDLDKNVHVTSKSYLAWAVEAVPLDIWQSSRLSHLEVHFLNEGFHPSTIFSRAKRIADVDGACTYLHSIVRESDQKELARLETRWVPR